MALAGKVPVLPGKLDENLETAEANLQLEKAAALVSEFAGEMAVPTLDRILESAAEAEQKAASESVGELAGEVTRQTDLLYDEVARFLTLSPANPN